MNIFEFFSAVGVGYVIGAAAAVVAGIAYLSVVEWLPNTYWYVAGAVSHFLCRRERIRQSVRDWQELKAVDDMIKTTKRTA
jgi:hypothetical protein